MSTTVVLGAQWGDEGKGKLVDILARESHLVCRAAGGNNAGHTIVADGVVYDFHILPSGLISPNAINLIGSGCVIHMPSLFAEMKALKEKGLQDVDGRLLISDRAQICFDLHVVVDGLEEGGRGDATQRGRVIGTTKKGIGPCYSDAIARKGVPVWMLFGAEAEDGIPEWERRLRDLERAYRKLFPEGLGGYSVEEEIERFKSYQERLRPLVVSQTPLLSTATSVESNQTVLVEGANALMLDIISGTYPFVTSSNTGIAGVFAGLGGLRMQSIRNVIGVVKAYTTRVGAGPFPTELTGAQEGKTLQTVGREFGVTTGRERRCGWLDLVVVKYSTEVNGYTAINLTKLDVLDSFPEIKVAVAYSVITEDIHMAERLDSFPANLEILESNSKSGMLHVEYETFKGWEKSTTGCKRWEDLPEEARSYVTFIESYVDVPITHIGTGPNREDMIQR